MEFLKQLQLTDENCGAMSGTGWQASKSNQLLASINPTDEKVIASVHTCSQQDYEMVIARAHEAFLQWREVPAPKRGEIVRQIAQRLRDMKDALGSLVSIEMGKSKQEGDGEVQEMIDIADFAVGQSRMLYGNTMHSERAKHRMYEQWHPLGVVGVISAFNFPVAVWAWNAFIAAICGDVVVWKPSSKTPLCAVAVQHICNEVLKKNNCPDVFSYFIPSDHSIADHFLDDHRVPLISFTGSTKTGRHVAQRVGQRLGRTILELGGNNAIIVDESADLELTLPAVLFGAVGTCGQRCTTTRRLFIHEKIHDQFLKQLVNAYAQLTVGDPLDKKNLVGPLVDQQAVKAFENVISEIKQAGGRIECGGSVIKRHGYFVEPTVVTRLPADHAIIARETFAPILYVLSFTSLDEVIAQHNNVPQGLSSAIFTNDLQHAEQFLSAIGSDCGIANVNIGTSGAEIGGAFGGEKETGGGREAGSDSWKVYMRRQTNTINWSRDLPLAQGITFSIKKR